MSIVVDSSPLVFLAAIGHFGLLRLYFSKIVIPRAVYHEVVVSGGERYGVQETQEGIQAGWIKIADPVDEHQIASLLQRGMTLADAHVVALAQETRASLVISDDSVVMGCIAFDTPFKGLDILLGAFAKVVRKYASIHLILVGVDPNNSSLPDQATQLGLSKNVHWAGIRDDGWQILNAADIYVQSSRFGEGLSLAIMEAMALKLPVISTRVAGQNEAVIDGKTGYLAEPDSIDSLANSLERLLNEPNRLKSMGKAGYERYQRFFKGENSIQTLVENYFEL